MSRERAEKPRRELKDVGEAVIEGDGRNAQDVGLAPIAQNPLPAQAINDVPATFSHAD